MSRPSPWPGLPALVAALTVTLSAPAGATTLVAPANADGTAPRPGRWDFAVTLDDKPIGRHRFELAGDPATGEWTLKSQAEYDVKILGLTVYTYRHSATERWRAGCLAQLEARTDDNGDVTSVQAAAPAGADASNTLRIAVRSVLDASAPAAARPVTPTGTPARCASAASCSTRRPAGSTPCKAAPCPPPRWSWPDSRCRPRDGACAPPRGRWTSGPQRTAAGSAWTPPSPATAACATACPEPLAPCPHHRKPRGSCP